MVYEPVKFDYLLGTAGFSDQLLKNHFTLYQGYVANTNKLVDSMSALLKEGLTASPGYAEIKRRFGWEFNGMRLHELYFGNLSKGGKPLSVNSEFSRRLNEQFGGYENWEKDFKGAGAMRGIGWVVLYKDTATGRMFNTWINEHDAGHLAGAVPLLVMDVFEHAYMIDYGLKRADYIEAFFKAINWSETEKRYGA